ncbi:family 20 glycosylhydrolase [Parabacteroides sp. OttesenSCG-928-N08]|nr:family 20 glycosylhydrolase [Parabacteroides sp. OttesenSCG-928-N08]
MITFPRRYWKQLGCFACAVVLLTGCGQQPPAPLSLIPQPLSVTQSSGYYVADELHYTKEQPTEVLSPEGYDLSVSGSGIVLRASTDAGFFYGEQTLRQLTTEKGIPFVEIKDEPRLPHRGLMLDVSRHFFPKEFVFKLLDEMSFYKLNKLHFHLTDGGGWRIQLDKYPELTQKAAFRTKENWIEWWNEGDRRFVEEGDPNGYGGYYTKEEIREIVRYAQERHITVIPEFEVPSHSWEVFVAYPHLSCPGEAYKNDDYCIGNEESFTFIENVLTEIMELFPSEYIHIGGDEAWKTAWKSCPKCQARMKKEGLTHVDELQSYMIHRVEEFVNAHGRKAIGWDEIMEGGLAPRATVMSWRGTNHGIQTARMGHDVIMAPGSHLYLDFYQADPITQPYAIGGYTPVKRVYSFDPVPTDSLTEAEQKHIIGLQGNLWTEYIATTDHVEYMYFPRALAVAEIGWTAQELRDWQDFKPRMNEHVRALLARGINAFPLSDEIEITMKVDTLNQQIEVIMDAEKHPVEICYTTDGTKPTAASKRYNGPIIVKDSAHIVAAIYREGKMGEVFEEKRVDYHRGINKPIQYNNRIYPSYLAGGNNALLDGYRGGKTYLDGRWQGYTQSLDCIIDMEEQTTIRSLSARFMQLTGPGVYQPGEVELFVSEDGEEYLSCGVIPTTVPKEERNLTFQEYTFRGEWKARYLRLKAKEANGRQFLFTDEIIIW